MAEIKLVNISKSYEGGVRALEDFSLCVADGEFLTLLGPSGCGKSSLLRLIAGLASPDSGEIYIDGELVNEMPPDKRNVALVFQSFALYSHMSVFENMAFPLRARHLSAEETERRVRETAELLQIEELLERRADKLSGGQQQRVSIGRALACRPSLLLMDEPLSNLDMQLRGEMRSELLKLRSSLKSTVIYVTHGQSEALALGDRVVVMREGRVSQEGTPVELYEKPANVFTASFIGSPAMNFFDAALKREGEKYSVVLGNKTTELSDEKSRALSPKQEGGIILGLRPESLKLLPYGAPDALFAELEFAEMLGGETLLHLRFQSARFVLRLTASEGCRAGCCGGFESGMRLGFSFEAEAMQLFDKETQERL